MYGKYTVPNEVIKMVELEKKLTSDGSTLATIMLRPTENFYYDITPYDAIPFANTGGDGIHFCFLTEFGQVKDLNEAPIVCVSPTNDPPIRLVANNIQDFLRLVISVPHAECLENWWTFDSEEQINQNLEEMKEFEDVSWNQLRQKIRDEFKSYFNLEPLDYLPYVKALKEQRAKEVALATKDGLGVMDGNAESSYQPYEFTYNLDEQEIQNMKDFLVRANLTEKLAFLRDVNFYHTVSSTEKNGLFEFVLEVLNDLELHEEYKRLKARVY